MQIFDIVVGISTIIGALAAVYSAITLHSISSRIENSGSNNTNNIMQNKGKQNKNIVKTIQK